MKLRIREVRKAKGISQTALARMIGKTSGTMWKYEHQIVPILAEDLYKTAKALDVTMDDLIVDDADIGVDELLVEDAPHA